jgi:hypothetical protein
MVTGRILVLLGVLALAGTDAGAEIYKCTDASGKAQYTDRPCGAGAAVITPRVAPAQDEDSDARMQKTRKLLRAYEEERRQEQQQKAEARAREEERERNCKLAKIRYRQITEANRVLRIDESGDQVVLSDQERSTATDQARQAVAKWCD